MNFYIIDGSALIYRAYYAFLKNPLTNSKGDNVAAVYGFANSILKIWNELKPDLFVITFDLKEKTFRHLKYPEYKANRSSMPEDLVQQLPLIFDFVEKTDIKKLSQAGFEADDIIGTLAKKAQNYQDVNTFIVSGDKDFMQLLGDKTFIYNIRALSKKEETKIFDTKYVIKKFGVTYNAFRDYLALVGDSSDNIPGVKGVGHKTAQKLIHNYENLENIYNNLSLIKPDSLRKKLETDKENAFLSKELVTIDTNMNITFNVEEYSYPDILPDPLLKWVEENEFYSLKKYFVKSKDLQREIIQKKQLGDEVEKIKTKYVQTQDDIRSFFKDCNDSDTFAISTYNNDEFLFISNKNNSLSLKLKDLDTKSIKTLTAVFANTNYRFLSFDIKKLISLLHSHFIILKENYFDISIAEFLLDPDNKNSLDINILVKYFSEVDLKYFTNEQVKDTDKMIGKNYLMLSLCSMLETRLIERKMLSLYLDIELPLIYVLACMEKDGVFIDIAYLEKLKDKFSTEIETLRHEILSYCGIDFNINSTQQLGEVLFDKLEIHIASGVKKVKKTKTGYSTSSDTLEQYLPLPVIKAILRYRQLTKLNSTYVESLINLQNPLTKRIHTSYNQTKTVTGRLSSTSPNLQNIPIRTEEGSLIRKVFIAPKNNFLISFDYSQIELRILAHLSGDPMMIEAFEANMDIHAITASQIFNVEMEEVTKEQRSQAKAVNFGVVYGMGAYKLSKNTNISFQEAASFIKEYFVIYNGVKCYINDQISIARKTEMVKTLFGRVRYLTDINSSSPAKRVLAEHMAINSPIQGTAADLIKLAMIRIQQEIIKYNYQSKMLMQVHDELIFEVVENEQEKLIKLVKYSMENAFLLRVPLSVNVGVGLNWLEAH